MLPYHGTMYADEHDLWVYFAGRFGLQNVGHMEPVPGVTPTTKQLGILVEKMRAKKVALIISVPYYDPKHARFLADKTGAKIAVLAHQVGAIKGADDYISMFDANINALKTALEGRR
jgi:ABC-type Zn uptake system ZnuABC Zn-binding protein ZnuA